MIIHTSIWATRIVIHQEQFKPQIQPICLLKYKTQLSNVEFQLFMIYDDTYTLEVNLWFSW